MSAAPHRRLLRFGPLAEPVRFTDCEELMEPLLSIFHGWDIADVSPSPTLAPAMRLTRTRSGYRRVSRWRDTPALAREKIRRTVVEAICGFHFEFIDWYAEAHALQLCVHGAAAEFEDGLVVFPAVQRAGKSTLTVHLASQGHRLFCDDVLPIEIATGLGVALGIQPRLRPPLPADAGAAFHEFVAERQGPTHRNRMYVRLQGAEIAPFGEQAPIKGLVLLERAPERSPGLAPVSEAEALETLILQNFAREAPPADILETLHRVVAGARCFRLIFGNVVQAGHMLKDAFGNAGEASASGRRDMPAPGVAAGTPYLRSARVSLREIDGALFLAQADSGTVFKLNQTGTALWNLLASGTSVEAAVAVFQAAFPGVEPQELAEEIQELYEDLLGEELIEPEA